MTKSFSSFNETYTNSVLIVDALNLSFRFMHAKCFDFADEFIKTIKSLAKSYHCGKVIIAADKGSSSYRMSIHDGYKGARKEKFADQTDTEKAEFELFFDGFNQALEKVESETNFTLFRFNKVEADDIAAYIVNNKNKFGFKTVWLISSDRDWDLLIQEGVSRFSTVSRKEITLENWHEHYDWTQEEYISIKCLQGDSGDSVPGVPGVGPTRALSLVRSYGSAMDVAANMPIPGKQKFIQAVNEFGAENILKNYQLMDLLTYCEEAIGPDNCKIINETLCI